MPKLTVLVDRYTWQTPIAGRPDRYDFHVAVRGETIDVTADEAARGQSLGALGDAGDLAVAEAAAGVPSVSDEQLVSMNVDELISHMGQWPTEVERVVALEDQRPRPRKTVLEAADRIAAARDEEAERLADEEQRRREEEAALAAAGAAPTLPG